MPIGLIEMGFSFGVVLILLFWQLWTVRKKPEDRNGHDHDRNEDKTP